ncbi:hypothetical protein D3C78_1503630 [compost metagenome]
MAAQVWHAPGDVRHFIGKGVNAAIFRRVQPVHVRRVLVIVQRMEHAEHGCLADTGGDQCHRDFRLRFQEEIPVRRSDINDVAFFGLLVQEVRYLALILSFYRNAIVLAIR